MHENIHREVHVQWAFASSFSTLVISNNFGHLVTDSLYAIWALAWQNQHNEWAPSENSDQPGHPLSLIRVFAVRMKKPWVLSYTLSSQRRLWSDWADWSESSLGAHSFCWFCHVAAHISDLRISILSKILIIWYAEHYFLVLRQYKKSQTDKSNHLHVYVDNDIV